MKRQLKQNKNSNLFLSTESRQKILENHVILAEVYFKLLKELNRIWSKFFSLSVQF